MSYYGLTGYSAAFHISLFHYSIVIDMNDDMAVLDVIKDRNSERGILNITIDDLNILKWKKGYRIERPLDFESLDFEKMIDVDILFSHRIDGFFINRKDADRVAEILFEFKKYSI